MPAQTGAPASHEIEVSVFGRGYGESVAVHIGSGQWLLVDSLLNAQGNPAALVYLSEIGVNAAEAVKCIVATHWHDDHVAGLSQIYEQCPKAQLSFPLALKRDEFRAFRKAVSSSGTERFGSGVRELEKVASAQRMLKRPAVRFAKANTILMRSTPAALAHQLPVSVELLSPSDDDIQEFLTQVASVRAPEPVGRAQPFARNDVSVAAWISIGPHRVLLGADLEVTSSPHTGWNAVVTSPAQLDGTAAIIKVPHHGSHNGHHPQVWSKLLTQQPTAVLAPFNRNPKLPRDSDIDRIVALTPNAFGTGRPLSRTKKRDSTVEKTLKENGLIVSAISDVGHVRARLDPNDPSGVWTVELFNGAARLDQLRAA
jgi:hypothetical protein